MSYAKDFMRRQATSASRGGVELGTADAVYVATGSSQDAVMPTAPTEAVRDTRGLAPEDDSTPRQAIWKKPVPPPRPVRDMSLGARVDRAVASLTTRPSKRHAMTSSTRPTEVARMSSRSQSVVRRSAVRSTARALSVASQKRSSSAPARRQEHHSRVAWRLSLGQAMRQAERPTLSQHGSKLSVASKCVTSLAEVPPQIASQVHQLHLSNNSLRSLSGTDDDDSELEQPSVRLRDGRLREHSQSLEPRDLRRAIARRGMGALGLVSFTNVRVLSLSNNQLHYLEDLIPLTQLPFLSTLALEGNMVARMPNYRAQLLHHLPKLEVLDTRAVVQGERQTASLSVRKEAPLQRACFENAATLDMLSRRLLPLLKLHFDLLAHRATRPPDYASPIATEDHHHHHEACSERQWPNGCAGKRKRPRPLGLVLQQWQPLARAVEADLKEARRVHRAIQDGLSMRFCHLLTTHTSNASKAGCQVAEASSAIVGRMSFAETASAWERVFTSALMAQQKALVEIRSDIESLRGGRAYEENDDDSSCGGNDLHTYGNSLWGTTTTATVGSYMCDNDSSACYGTILWGPPIMVINEEEEEARAPKEEEEEAQGSSPPRRPLGLLSSSPPVSPGPLVSLRPPPTPMTPPARPRSSSIPLPLQQQPLPRAEPHAKSRTDGRLGARVEGTAHANAHANQERSGDTYYREDREWAAWEETVREVADELQHGSSSAAKGKVDEYESRRPMKEAQPTDEPSTSIASPPSNVGVHFQKTHDSELGSEDCREGYKSIPVGASILVHDMAQRAQTQAEEEIKKTARPATVPSVEEGKGKESVRRSQEEEEEEGISLMKVPPSELAAAESVLVDTCSDPTEAALLVDTFKGQAVTPQPHQMLSPYWGSSEVHLDSLAHLHVTPASAAPHCDGDKVTDDALSLEKHHGAGDFARAFACFGDGDASSMRDLEKRVRQALEILAGLQNDHSLLEQRAADLSSALEGLKQLRTSRIATIRVAESALRAQLEATEKVRESLILQEEVATEADAREEAALEQQLQKGLLSEKVSATVEVAIAAAVTKACSGKIIQPSPQKVVLSQHVAVAEGARAELSSLLIGAEKRAKSIMTLLDEEIARVRELTEKTPGSSSSEGGCNEPLRRAKGKVARAYAALLLACDVAKERLPVGCGRLTINESKADYLARKAVGSLLPSVDHRLMRSVWTRLVRIASLRRRHRLVVQPQQVQRKLRSALKTLRQTSVMKRVLRLVSSKQDLRSAFLGWVFGVQALAPFKHRQSKRRLAKWWRKWLIWHQQQKYHRHALNSESHFQPKPSSSRHPLPGLVSEQQRQLLRPKGTLQRVLKEWQLHASKAWHAASLQALAFWCRSILMRWHRAAVASATVLSLRGDRCCALHSLHRWQRALVLHRLKRLTQTRRHFLRFRAYTLTAHRERELNNTATFLGKRSRILRTWQRLRQHAVTCSAARRALIRLTSVHAKQSMSDMFWFWTHDMRRVVRRRETSALAITHAAVLQRRRAFGHFKKGVRHITHLKTTLKLFILAWASIRVTRAFRSWLWCTVHPQRLRAFHRQRTIALRRRIFKAWHSVVMRSTWLKGTASRSKKRSQRMQMRKAFGQWWHRTVKARMADERASNTQTFIDLEEKARAIMVRAMPSWSLGKDDGNTTSDRSEREVESKLSGWLRSIEEGLHVAAKKGSGLAEEVKKWRRKVQYAQKDAISGHASSEGVQASAQNAAAEATKLESDLATKVEWLKATEAAADLLRQELDAQDEGGSKMKNEKEEESSEVQLQASHAQDLEHLKLEATQCAQREQSARAELLPWSRASDNTTLGPQTHGGRVDLQAVSASKAERDAEAKGVAANEAALNLDLVAVRKELKHAVAMGTTLKACQKRDATALHEATTSAAALRKHLTTGTEKVALLEERLRSLQSAEVKLRRTLQLKAQDEQEAQVALAAAARSALRAARRGSARAARLVDENDDDNRSWKEAKKYRAVPSATQPLSTSLPSKACSSARRPAAPPQQHPQSDSFAPHSQPTNTKEPSNSEEDENTPLLMAAAASRVRQVRAPLHATARALASAAGEKAAGSLASQVAEISAEFIVEFTVAESVAECVQHMGDSCAEGPAQEEGGHKHHMDHKQQQAPSSFIAFSLKQSGVPLQIPSEDARLPIPRESLLNQTIRQKGRALSAQPGAENQPPPLPP